MTGFCSKLRAGLGIGVVALTALATTTLPAAFVQRAPLAIRQVTPERPQCVRFARVEWTVDLTANYQNPFNPEDIAVDLTVQTPTGRKLSVPGFFYQAFQREQEQGREKLQPQGDPEWRIRFVPEETGLYRVTVQVRDHSGTVSAGPYLLDVVPGNDPGFVRVSPRDPRFFEHDNGTPFFGIGANVCWSYAAGTYDYDLWFPRYAQEGCNFARLWLSPHWSPFALEQPGKPGDGKGLGFFSQAHAWRLDYVQQLAEKLGLRLKFCIDSYNILRQKDGYPQWDNTPHNLANGGPLKEPADFWNNAEMDRLYRYKLRYLVARYGASTHLLSWEFWNEVDITTGYRTQPALAWHEKMAAHLRVIDPYRHLLTTSFANTPGDAAIDQLSLLDYSQTHHYGSPDLVPTLVSAQLKKTLYRKPHYVGEIGADAGGPRGKDDPRGYQVHDPMWASAVSGGAACAQSWWWDNLIQPQNLYPLFGPLARFVKGIDWPAEKFHAIQPKVEWQTAPNPLPRADLVLSQGPVSWETGGLNRPHEVTVTSAGQASLNPAGILHGRVNHTNLHNPVTFQLNHPRETPFDLLVGDVSGHGGARVRITLDGQPAIEKDFADTDNSTATLKQYAGPVRVLIPAGKHTLKIENTGRDWFLASYRFKDALVEQNPPVLAWGQVGQKTVLIWLRVKDASWKRLCTQPEPLAPAPPTILTIPLPSNQEWQAEVWDTWTGEIIVQPRVERQANQGRIRIPTFNHDLAIKLVRQHG